MTAPFIRDGDLTLRPMRDTDADYALMQRWLSDKRVLEWYEGRDTRATPEWVRENYNTHEMSEERVTPCIIERDGVPIGYLQFYLYDAPELVELGLPGTHPAYGIDLFIGEPALWGLGIGTRLLRATLRYLFALRGATLVTIDPIVENRRAIRTYEKAGFRPFKVLSSHELHEGALHDVLLMTAQPEGITMVATTNWTEVERVAREAEAGGGTVGVAASAPDGSTFAYNAEHQFPAASTIKIPIMVTVFRQIDAVQRALSDPYTLRAEAKAPGSGVLLHLHDPLELTLADLLYLMISISDNTATNILIDMATFDGVNETIRSLGMTGSRLGRKMLDRRARDDEQENLATALDFTRAVRSILDGSAASAESCAAMADLLTKQQNPRRIGRFVPAGEGVRWDSKTGSIAGIVNDAGFITTPAGTLVIAVLTEGLSDPHTGERVIGEITRAAMQATGLLGQT